MTSKWDSAAEQDLWADICQHNKSSLWWFVQRAFGVTNPGNLKGSWLIERVHRPICDWFELHAREWLAWRRAGVNKQKNLFIVVPRDFGKSVLITKAGMLWLHLQDPELSTYIGSITKDMAGEFLDPIKKVMAGDDAHQWFTHLYGSWISDQWTAENVVHACRRAKAVGEPSFGIWGAATGLVGKHPDVLCFDDPISYPRMETHSGWVEYVNRHVTALIPVLKGNGLRVHIGTCYHDGDWIGRAKKTGIASIDGMSMPNVKIKPDAPWHVYFLAARAYDGTPIYPERWDDKQLRDYEAENKIEYYAQMLNDPASESVMSLTRRQVDQLWVEPKDVPGNLRISVHIDTAFKYKERTRTGDESVIQVWGHSRDGSGDVYFIEGYGSNEWRAEDFNNKLTLVMKSLRARAKWPFILTDETEMHGKQGSWELTIVNWFASAGLPPANVVLLNRAGKKKLSRMLACASFWVDGRVKLVRGAPGVEKLIDQMLKIGVSEHDDWADAASDVFHPEVYKPMRLAYNEEEGMLPRPYDEQLQDGMLSISSQVHAWKRARRSGQEEMLAWSAIGADL